MEWRPTYFICSSTNVSSRRGTTNTDAQVDSFIQAVNTYIDVGDKGKAMLKDGLADVGLAPNMDDDDYEPKPDEDSLKTDAILSGVRTILLAQARAENPEQQPQITDEQVEALITALYNYSNVGQRGREVLERGLFKIGVAKYMDDSK